MRANPKRTSPPPTRLSVPTPRPEPVNANLLDDAETTGELPDPPDPDPPDPDPPDPLLSPEAVLGAFVVVVVPRGAVVVVVPDAFVVVVVGAVVVVVGATVVVVGATVVVVVGAVVVVVVGGGVDAERRASMLPLDALPAPLRPGTPKTVSIECRMPSVSTGVESS